MGDRLNPWGREVCAIFIAIDVVCYQRSDVMYSQCKIRCRCKRRYCPGQYIWRKVSGKSYPGIKVLFGRMEKKSKTIVPQEFLEPIVPGQCGHYLILLRRCTTVVLDADYLATIVSISSHGVSCMRSVPCAQCRVPPECIKHLTIWSCVSFVR